jgi:hypothetical protein
MFWPSGKAPDGVALIIKPTIRATQPLDHNNEKYSNCPNILSQSLYSAESAGYQGPHGNWAMAYTSSQLNILKSEPLHSLHLEFVQ